MHAPYGVCHVTCGVGDPLAGRGGLHQHLCPPAVPTRAPSRAWWSWPTTRRPAGGGSTGAGSHPGGRTCWPRSCCAPAATGPTCICARGRVALAAADACREVAGVEPVLKWPNDLLIGGSKLAGVLAEAEFSGGALASVVIGIGINVAWPGPEGAGGTCLDDLGGTAQPVDRQVLLEHLLGALAARRPLLDEPSGRAALADEVRRRCATLGQHVRVVLPERGAHGSGRRHRRRGASRRGDGLGAPQGDGGRRGAPSPRLSLGKADGAGLTLAALCAFS